MCAARGGGSWSEMGHKLSNHLSEAEYKIMGGGLKRPKKCMAKWMDPQGNSYQLRLDHNQIWHTADNPKVYHHHMAGSPCIRT